ncbi:MAG TPA: trypsin-like serine protease, partial [Mycobacterium sp.]|nr:trypsin-like serine protease [Mycobacterium sp.]
MAAPAAAIFNGGPDGTDHPEVGALLAAQAFSDGTWAFCTGTLVAPDVVLTAAHCQVDVDGDRRTGWVAMCCCQEDGRRNQCARAVGPRTVREGLGGQHYADVRVAITI